MVYSPCPWLQFYETSYGFLVIILETSHPNKPSGSYVTFYAVTPFSLSTSLIYVFISPFSLHPPYLLPPLAIHPSERPIPSSAKSSLQEGDISHLPTCCLSWIHFSFSVWMGFSWRDCCEGHCSPAGSLVFLTHARHCIYHNDGSVSECGYCLSALQVQGMLTFSK